MELTSQQKMVLMGGKVAFSAVIVILLLVACTYALSRVEPPGPSTQEAKRAFEELGYTDVQNVQRHYWGSSWVYGCGRDDSFAFTADVITTRGTREQRTICSGMFIKGFTPRVGR